MIISGPPSLRLIKEYSKRFRHIKFIIMDVMYKILSASVAFDDYNWRAIVANPNFKRIISSVHICLVFISSFSAICWPENKISGHRTFLITKQYSKQFRHLQVYYRYVMCEICNVPFFPWWLEQTCNRTNMPNLNFKGNANLSFVSLYSFSAFSWPENAISRHRSFCPSKQYRKHFRCLELYNRDLVCDICNFPIVIRTNMQSYKRAYSKF